MPPALAQLVDKLTPLRNKLTSAVGWLKNNFSKKVFLIGLGSGLGVYALIAGWILFNTDTTLKNKQDKLASQTVIIEDRTAENKTTEDDTTNRLKAALARKNKGRNVDIAAAYGLKKLPGGLLNASPIEELSVTTSEGRFPVTRDDGLTAFKAYRAPFDLHDVVDKSVISIAIMNLGLSDAATEKAIKTMPSHISLILSPYTPLPDFWIKEARAHNHEVWLSLPTETENYPLYDPGPHTLLISAAEKENRQKLRWVLSRAEGYVGFVTERAPTFVKSTEDIRPIINEIYTRGLAFVDGSTDSYSILPQSMAHNMKSPYAAVDVWLDTIPNEIYIRDALKKLETIAKERGMAAGVINAYPLSYKMIQQWMKTLPEKGIVMAPLSAQTGF